MNRPRDRASAAGLLPRMEARPWTAGAVTRRFIFHDLRAFYATEYRERTGELPDMHASKVTTARVYDRAKSAKRGSL